MWITRRFCLLSCRTVPRRFEKHHLRLSTHYNIVHMKINNPCIFVTDFHYYEYRTVHNRFRNNIVENVSAKIDFYSRTGSRSWIFEKMWTLGVPFWCGVHPARRGVFLSDWLNHSNSANSDPTSWKCEVVRGPHGLGWSRKWIFFYLRLSRHFFVSVFTYA
jgi:hypothetical protein